MRIFKVTFLAIVFLSVSVICSAQEPTSGYYKITDIVDANTLVADQVGKVGLAGVKIQPDFEVQAKQFLNYLLESSDVYIYFLPNQAKSEGQVRRALILLTQKQHYELYGRYVEAMAFLKIKLSKGAVLDDASAERIASGLYSRALDTYVLHQSRSTPERPIGLSLNELMIKEGFTLIDENFDHPIMDVLGAADKTAKENKSGFWSENKMQPDFNKLKQYHKQLLGDQKLASTETGQSINLIVEAKKNPEAYGVLMSRILGKGTSLFLLGAKLKMEGNEANISLPKVAETLPENRVAYLFASEEAAVKAKKLLNSDEEVAPILTEYLFVILSNNAYAKAVLNWEPDAEFSFNRDEIALMARHQTPPFRTRV